MGHVSSVRADTGEVFYWVCSRYGCEVCGPRRRAYVALVLHRRLHQSLAAGLHCYRLDLTGGQRGMWIAEASEAWKPVARHLRRRLEVQGYSRILHLDPSRVGVHFYAPVVLPVRLGREEREELHQVVVEAGFGPSWGCWRIGTRRSATRRANYAVHALVSDGQALAGSGTKLVSWSRSWQPHGWVG